MSFKVKALKFYSRKIATKAGFAIGATTAGAVVGATTVQPGLRKQGALEGALHGAAVGSLPFIAKPIAKVIKRGLQSGPMANKFKTVFRKFRGRIVPIKVKV